LFCLPFVDFYSQITGKRLTHEKVRISCIDPKSCFAPAAILPLELSLDEHSVVIENKRNSYCFNLFLLA